MECDKETSQLLLKAVNALICYDIAVFYAGPFYWSAQLVLNQVQIEYSCHVDAIVGEWDPFLVMEVPH